MNTLITPVSDNQTRDTSYGNGTSPSAADDPRDLRSRQPATPYMEEQKSSQAGERWQRIQSEFVDDPRESVAQAHQLVSDLMQHIIETFGDERRQLEQQWSEGQSVSTEDLRVCLQRYRSFFTRLLPLEQKPLEDR